MNRDNPQETLTDAECGWLAGMIEGDGYISFTAQTAAQKKKDGGLVVMPKVGVTNTDALIIEKVKNLFDRLGGGSVVNECVGSPMSRKVAFDIRTNKLLTCCRVLTVILPHLAGEKSARARLILDFVSSRLDHRHCPYTAEEFATIREFFTNHVNAKGQQRSGKALMRFLRDYTPSTPMPRNGQGQFVTTG
jgi:hypothetical protein